MYNIYIHRINNNTKINKLRRLATKLHNKMLIGQNVSGHENILNVLTNVTYRVKLTVDQSYGSILHTTCMLFSSLEHQPMIINMYPVSGIKCARSYM